MRKLIRNLIIIAVIILIIYIIFFGMFWISGEEVFGGVSDESLTEIVIKKDGVEIKITDKEDIEDICNILKSYKFTKPLQAATFSDEEYDIELIGDDCDVSVSISGSVVKVCDNTNEDSNTAEYKVRLSDSDNIDKLIEIINKY